RAAVSVQADDLPVEDGVAHASECDRDLGGERGEVLEGVAVAGDEPTLPVLDVGERPEAVELQFKEPVGVVERVAASRQRERRESGKRAGHGLTRVAWSSRDCPHLPSACGASATPRTSRPALAPWPRSRG